MTQLQQIYSNSTACSHSYRAITEIPKTLISSPLPLKSPTHFCNKQEDSDQGNPHGYKATFSLASPSLDAHELQKPRKNISQQLVPKLLCSPSRPSAFLYLAFIQLGNTHLIAFIYVQKGLLKSKWIKSWSGKEIKLYCSTAQAVHLGCHVMQAMRVFLCKRHWEFNVAAQPVTMHLADV